MNSAAFTCQSPQEQQTSFSRTGSGEFSGGDCSHCKEAENLKQLLELTKKELVSTHQAAAAQIKLQQARENFLLQQLETLRAEKDHFGSMLSSKTMTGHSSFPPDSMTYDNFLSNAIPDIQVDDLMQLTEMKPAQEIVLLEDRGTNEKDLELQESLKNSRDESCLEMLEQSSIHEQSHESMVADIQVDDIVHSTEMTEIRILSPCRAHDEVNPKSESAGGCHHVQLDMQMVPDAAAPDLALHSPSDGQYGGRAPHGRTFPVQETAGLEPAMQDLSTESPLQNCLLENSLFNKVQHPRVETSFSENVTTQESTLPMMQSLGMNMPSSLMQTSSYASDYYGLGKLNGSCVADPSWLSPEYSGQTTLGASLSKCVPGLDPCSEMGMQNTGKPGIYCPTELVPEVSELQPSQWPQMPFQLSDMSCSHGGSKFERQGGFMEEGGKARLALRRGRRGPQRIQASHGQLASGSNSTWTNSGTSFHGLCSSRASLVDVTKELQNAAGSSITAMSNGLLHNKKDRLVQSLKKVVDNFGSQGLWPVESRYASQNPPLGFNHKLGTCHPIQAISAAVPGRVLTPSFAKFGTDRLMKQSEKGSCLKKRKRGMPRVENTGNKQSKAPMKIALPPPPDSDLKTMLKTLPKQGELLKTVIEAGPLLQTLLDVSPSGVCDANAYYAPVYPMHARYPFAPLQWTQVPSRFRVPQMWSASSDMIYSFWPDGHV